jgi:hypothetical protein
LEAVEFFAQGVEELDVESVDLSVVKPNDGGVANTFGIDHLRVIMVTSSITES